MKYFLIMQQNAELVTLHVDPRAYRFFPNESQQKSSFDSKGIRFMADGQIKPDQYEKQQLAEFEKYLQSHNIQINRNLWTPPKLLRYINAAHFNFKNLLDFMGQHEQFIKEYIGPNESLVQYEPVKYLLDSGMYYVSGRDYQFRPVVVVDAGKMDLQHPEACLRAAIVAHEQILGKMCLPGQIQNWNVIFNIAEMGITDIPFNILKDCLQKIAINYCGRLHKLWVVNAPTSIDITWKIVSTFLDPVTLGKVHISKANTDTGIFSVCDPSQVEEKYGGSQPNRTFYWPFAIPPGVFNESRLISPQEYEYKLQTGELSHNLIDPKYLQHHY